MSQRKDNTIDYLDLSIPLGEDMPEVIKAWVAEFEESHTYIEATPRVSKGVLLINSTDFIAMLGYVNPADCSEFALYRFRAEARRQLESQLAKSTALTHQGHYKWCLTALKSFEMGRFL